MTASPERHEFQAEVKQLLDLMIHSLYSDRDVFLRELISNASDALDKLRFEQLTKGELGATGEPAIQLEANREARTLSVSDNGIGMSREEVIRNIGTIARSGTKEFTGALARSTAKDIPALIGQFGVGFYSAFMVADRLELVTRRAGEATATRWESVGDGAYTISDAERDQPGTTVTLHLKPADPEHGLADYADDAVIAPIVKRYSDFVGYPVRMKDKTLNSMKAIWDRAKGEVSEDEYKQFYRHVSHDWNDPLKTIPVKIEGTYEANALLYIPSKAPFDLYNAEMKRGLQLYVKRVFVMDECRDLIPAHLRFVRGVVDAHDLSLNVSREILQKDRQIQVIRKQLVKKVLGALEELQRDAPDQYAQFWTELGPVLKEGLATHDAESKDKVLELVMAASTKHERTSIGDYVSRMKEGQDAIYYLVGTSKDTVAKSPLLEAFVAKGYEVLLFSDPIDEFWLERAPAFRDKPMKSIGRGDIDLGATATTDDERARFADLLACLRVELQEEVKEVRLSQRLATSAACLVTDEHDMTPRMQRMMEQMGQALPKVKRILEINPQHPLVEKLRAIFAESHADPRLGQCARLLYGQAHLAESGTLPDLTMFTQALTDIMLRAT
ncbi:MAG TPA: molecular chaperone HtpG [Kofleriaceae bacterium]|jgi:molecular chaperone HtpG